MKPEARRERPGGAPRPLEGQLHWAFSGPRVGHPPVGHPPFPLFFPGRMGRGVKTAWLWENHFPSLSSACQSVEWVGTLVKVARSNHKRAGGLRACCPPHSLGHPSQYSLTPGAQACPLACQAWTGVQSHVAAHTGAPARTATLCAPEGAQASIPIAQCEN